LHNLPLLALVSAIVAFVMSNKFNLYPIIIYVSKTKGLMDEPGERRVHSSKIPNLGGMAIFITFCLTTLLFVSFLRVSVYDLSNVLSIISALIILLFLGVKDDLVFITANKKLLIQLIAVSMVCVLEDVRITNFHGLLGIGELPYIISILFSIFVFALVINALNLIDGIDGLAASIAILGSLSFGIFFLMAGYYLMTLMSAILIGSLLGFLKYNLSVNSKIFMGDCGSMIVGFLLAYQGITFLEIQSEVLVSYNPENAPVLLLAILSYPLFDLLRVFSIRIMQKKSPFTADNNHIHHRLLRLGLNHKQSTLLLFSSNLILVLITYSTINLPINLNLIVSVFFGMLIYLLPFLSVFEEYEPPKLLANDLAKEKAMGNTDNAFKTSDVFDRPIYQHEEQFGSSKVLSEEIQDSKDGKLVFERNLRYKKMIEREREAKKKFGASNHKVDTE
ncbi:MAG: MraY family glycosyltransferase, partial [Maribacter sp.]